MNRTRSLIVFRAGVAILLALTLTGCQALAEALPALLNQPTAVAELAITPFPTETPATLEPLPPTYTPNPEQPQPTPTVLSGLPEMLEDFPLWEGAQVIAAQSTPEAGSAEVTLQTHRSPGELAVFYRKALEESGWTLRFSEGNAVGGFLQEWRKEQQRLTVEYHFLDGQPVVSIDSRLVDSNRALAMLLGFPLPNGTEVLRAGGSAIELYVPLDSKATVDFFRAKVAEKRWRFEAIKPAGWCGSRGCQETLEKSYAAIVTLEPVPTTDNVQKLETYRATMPDRTLADITFLPRRDHTRVHIKIHFLDFTRSGIQVSLYPGATITGIFPGVAMFETTADIKDVVTYYEDRMAGMNWEAYDFTVNQPDQYTRSWTKPPHRVVTLTLSVEKGTGIVHGTLNCSTCRDPFFVIPTQTPTPVPSR